MTVETISPSGERYIFKEPKYLKIVVKEDDREIIYWFKRSTKAGKGFYLNSQPPQETVVW